MPQQLLHDFEFGAHTSPERRMRMAKRVPANAFLDSDLLRDWVEHVFVKSLVPKMDAVLGAVCSQKSGRRALCTLIVFATPKAR